MMIEEMKKLKVGDILIDMHMTKQQKDNEIVLCKIVRIDKEIGVVCTSVDDKYKRAYPHRFWYKNDYNDIEIYKNKEK